VGIIKRPNDGASAAAHLRPVFILAENAKPYSWLRIRRLGRQPQARVGLFIIGFNYGIQ